MTDSSTDNFGATTRLNALLAGINVLSSSTQPSAVRQYLEYGLERLQALEQEHYTFLGECAQLAADNLQDIRVRDLEQRVTALEAPDEATWGETFLAVVTNIALQLLVLWALEELAVQVIAFAANAEASAKIRAAVAELKYAPNTTKQDLRMALENVTNRKRAVDLAPQALNGIAEAVRSGNIPPGGFAILVDTDVIETVKSLDDWYEVADEVTLRRLQVRDQMMLARQALAENEAKALTAYDHARTKAGDEAIHAYSAKWRDWIGGEKGGLALTPGYMLLDQARLALLNAHAAQSNADPDAGTAFLTSTVSGRFLSYASNMRLQVAEEYAALRLHVRYTDDNALKDDQQIASLAYMVAAALPHFEGFHQIAQLVRPWIVTGFETYYWLDFLRVNGCLDENGGPRVLPGVTYQGGPQHDIGSFVDGFVILAYAEGPPPEPVLDVEGLGAGVRHWLTLYKADFYCGVTVLTDLQAEYLYHRFAKPYFADQAHVNAAHLPFTYAEANYQYLLAEQPRLWEGYLTSEERTTRLNEMRFLVIMFFATLPAMSPDPRLDEFLGQGTAASVQTFLAGGSFGIVPELVDPATATANALEAAREPARALQEAIGTSDTQQLQYRLLGFADMLTDLNFDMLNYAQQAAAGDDAAPYAKSLDELNTEIQDEQLAVSSEYEAIKALAEDDPALQKSIVEMYDDTVRQLLAWEQTPQWRWYGSEPRTEP